MPEPGDRRAPAAGSEGSGAVDPHQHRSSRDGGTLKHRRRERQLFVKDGAADSSPVWRISDVCSSRSWRSYTATAALSQQGLRARGLREAITSRSDSAPAIIVTIRSRPNAMPPAAGGRRTSAHQQEAELRTGLLGSDLQPPRRPCFALGLVDRHRAAPNFQP